MRQRTALALLLLAATSPVLAQEVGHVPAKSPYRDIAFKQEITPFAGSFQAGGDPAGVAPRSGPMVGARYEIRIGGPAQFMARVGHVWSERRVIDPILPVESRDLGTMSTSLYLADVGISLNLTGQKSWRGLVPVINGGAGVVSDFKGADAGGFRFGTQFAISLGGGVRWVPQDSRLQLRVDLADYLYQISYPTSYIVETEDQPRVTRKQSAWTNNLALTAGVSYRFFR